MQFASNTTLASALAPGQKRYFAYKLMFDWQRNGSFTDPNSDLSANFLGGKRNRQLQGVFPSDLQVTQGYSSAQFTFKLGGIAPDGSGPLWRLFSPAAGGLYSVNESANVPMYFSVLVWLKSTLEWFEIRQFTGFVRSAVPSAADGEVMFTCLDAASQMEAPVTCYHWAIDKTMRQNYYASGSNAALEWFEAMTATNDWLIDHLLRKAGFFQQPQFHPNAVVGWTLRGSCLPEVGAINQNGLRNWSGTLNPGAPSSGGSPQNLPQATPAGMPLEIYELGGMFGGACFKGRNKIGTYNGNARSIDSLDGVAYLNTRLPIRSYGSNNSNILCFALLVKVDPTLSAGTLTWSQIWLDYTDNTQSFNPWVVDVTVNQQTGSSTMTVFRWGGSTTHTFNSTVNMATGWHYCQFILSFTSTGIFGYMMADGAHIGIAGSNGGAPGVPLGAAVSTFPTGATNLARISVNGPAQGAHWHYQHNTAVANFTWAPSAPPTDVRQRAKVDIGVQRLLYLPEIKDEAAWDALSQATNNDLGALYVNEFGTPIYDARSTIKSRQTAANSVKTVTRDEVYDLNPRGSFDSIANVINWRANPRVANENGTIYQTTKADQFLVPANSSAVFNATVDDAVAVKTGFVPWRPRAQGYDPPGSQSTWWENFMQYYSPDFYSEGFTAYQPNSRNPANPPYQSTGLDCQPRPGWFDYDQDPRHLRIATLSGTYTPAGATVMEYAVDDSRPFLKIGGTKIEDEDSIDGSATDAASVAKYGSRSWSWPNSEWTQDKQALIALSAALLADTKAPQVYYETVEIPGDPRLQLQDVFTIADPGGFETGYAMLVGQDTTYGEASDPKITDTCKLKSFA